MADNKHVVMDDASWEKSYVDFKSLPDLPKELSNKVDAVLAEPQSSKAVA